MPKKFIWTPEAVAKLKELRTKRYQIKEIAKIMGTGYKSVSEAIVRYAVELGDRKLEAIEPFIDDDKLIAIAHERGYTIGTTKELRGQKHIKIDIDRFEGEKFEIGLVSDTQLCSRYQQLTYLHDAYAYFEKRGITTVFHAGDLLDGWTVYRGHQFEVFLIGNDKQAGYVIDNYPKKKGIKTHVIGGQHDYVFKKDRDFDVLKAIAKEREDIESLGYFGGYIKIGRKTHYLHHPGGGIAYARSYKTQKMIENFVPELKPHFLYRGHHHLYCQMFYRNVIAIDLPCFQSQTPYLAEKGYNPEIGFLILKYRINEVGIKDNLAMYEIEHYPFFIPRENDF